MSDGDDGKFHAPGVLVLACIFLVTFIIVWYAHLKWIADLWELG